MGVFRAPHTRTPFFKECPPPALDILGISSTSKFEFQTGRVFSKYKKFILIQLYSHKSCYLFIQTPPTKTWMKSGFLFVFDLPY